VLEVSECRDMFVFTCNRGYDASFWLGDLWPGLPWFAWLHRMPEMNLMRSCCLRPLDSSLCFKVSFILDSATTCAHRLLWAWSTVVSNIAPCSTREHLPGWREVGERLERKAVPEVLPGTNPMHSLRLGWSCWNTWASGSAEASCLQIGSKDSAFLPPVKFRYLGPEKNTII
jgi:hypothetical protein